MTREFPNVLTEAQFDAISQFVKKFKNESLETQARRFFSCDRELLIQSASWDDKRNLLRTEERFKQVFEKLCVIGDYNQSNTTDLEVETVASLFKRKLPNSSVTALKLIHANGLKIADVSRTTGIADPNLRRTSKNFSIIKSEALEAFKLFDS